MLAHVTEAFILGLSMGPACLGYCSPVCIPLLACQRRPWKDTACVLGVFLLGRFVGYSVVGAVAGTLGTLLLQNLNPAIWSSVRILMGIALALFALVVEAPQTRWFRGLGLKTTSFGFAACMGLLTGVNLCPPFGVALAGAAACASVRNAVVYFWAFFAGTAVYFGPLLLINPFSRSDAFRHVARICLFLAGSWLAAEGIAALVSR